MYKGPQLAHPSSLLSPAQPAPMGPTRIGEWLMIDIRVAKQVGDQRETYARLHAICQALSERTPPACGVVESTLLIDLVEVKRDDRLFLLNRANWPSGVKTCG